MAPAELSVVVFVQLAAIVAAARLVGWLGRRLLGQPQVVGEMIAGVLLGPSLFGLLAPGLQAALFPPDARGVLYVLAQLGVGLYMFLVGLGFDRDRFRAEAGSAAAVSLAGMAAPFLVAAALAPWLMRTPGLVSPRLDTLQATLFLGACISITAFPMLARIVHERGLSRSPLGALALSAGAVDDAGAWIVLAVVLASLGAGPLLAVKAIAGGLLFAVVVLGLGPRLLAPLGRLAQRQGQLSPGLLAAVLVLFLASAFATDALGLHAVFGGFLLGVAMPRGPLADQLRARLEPLATVLLLPVFFTFAGLQTELSLIAAPSLLLVAAVVLAGAVLAKGGACWAAARLTGQPNPTALAIGALMNARGLMGLIIIDVGLQRGLIEPALFSILALVAVVTTLMASPLFEAVYGRQARARGDLPPSLHGEGRLAKGERGGEVTIKLRA
jgi:Kef-type K+ transport system membrane component KefB